MLAPTYEKYEARLKMAPADGVRYAILLWPSKVPAACGGEIDFGEDNGGNRTSSELTVQLHGGRARWSADDNPALCSRPA